MSRGKISGIVILTTLLSTMDYHVARAVVTIETVPVGNPSNTGDQFGWGQVNYAYNISKYDVTLGQYTEFLNAVARNDNHSLFKTSAPVKISRSGSAGNYTYAPTINPNYPATFVSFFDACRFANWMQNGQPTSVDETAGTTETGAYDLTIPGVIQGNSVTRNTSTNWAIPTLNEWYKAAYYDPSLNAGAGGYWLYPTRSNTTPNNTISASDTNSANFKVGTGVSSIFTDPTNFYTPVGSFAGSPSAYGTFDQGGDVWQWLELRSGDYREIRGGSYGYGVEKLQSVSFTFADPANWSFDEGFRLVQSVPEPTSITLLAVGLVAMSKGRSRSRAFFKRL